MVEDELARYGIAVLYSWIVDGSLQSRIRRLSGHAVHLSSEHLADHDGLSELVHTTVAVALRQFRRRALAGTGWQPEKGASVRTFFIGRCLLSFPNEYRRWVREQRQWGPLPPVPLREAEHLAARDPLSRPEELVIDRRTVHALLVEADPRTRRALVGLLYGYPQAVIAAELGMTIKSIEMLLYRHRRRLRNGAAPHRRTPPEKRSRYGRGDCDRR
ncbi:hypothetical protein AB0C51_16095 [Streptomyces pathocidini]|uniref:hypothetical protein n=1 Tax=Streptomyces pathocidini TaxID=1650571 RepID=UPI0033DCB339